MSLTGSTLYSDSSLVSYWKLDGNSNDSKGTNNGANTNVSFVAGKFDNCASFAGNGYVNCGNPANLQLTTQSYSCWFKTSGAGSSYRGIMIKEGCLSLFLVDGVLGCYDWGAGGGLRSTGVNYNDGVWHHVVITNISGSANNTKIYVDNVLKLTTTSTVGNQTGSVIFGAGGLSTSVQNITGTIDDCAVFNKILTADEITNIYYSGIVYNLDYVLVAGGGRGGNAGTGGSGGGGGAGGMLSGSTIITFSSYPIVIGGSSQNSTFNSLTALAGGVGADNGGNGNAGGSGGGAGGNGTARTGGAGTAGQGNNGAGGSAYTGFGGGGKGGAGSGQFGGIGLASSIGGSSVTYAAGGNGGTSFNSNGSAGASNTGNGGVGAGGTSSSYFGGAGGSGICIVRYLTSALGVNVGFGGTKTVDGSYTVHTFTSSGTFSINPPQEDFDNFKVLVVAGGGGGANTGSGAGAGGVIFVTGKTLTASGYTVTVGNGGNGGADVNSPSNGSNGQNSVIADLTAIGGGGGVTHGTGTNTLGGGSGGGASITSTGSAGTGGTPTSGQGFAGGAGFVSATWTGNSGGGGGAGQAGSAGGNTNVTGKGGDGILNPITSTGYIAGGGAGGEVNGAYSIAGGLGGGGGSTPSARGTDGSVNTGSGGGGGSFTGAVYKGGGNGGSGIVQIKYVTSKYGTCTGGTITTDGIYTIHTFTTSGTFTVVAKAGGINSGFFLLF